MFLAQAYSSDFQVLSQKTRSRRYKFPTLAKFLGILEAKGRADCTNGNRVIVTVLIGIENHDDTWSDADVIANSETVESL